MGQNSMSEGRGAHKRVTLKSSLWSSFVLQQEALQGSEWQYPADAPGQVPEREPRVS